MTIFDRIFVDQMQDNAESRAIWSRAAGARRTVEVERPTFKRFEIIGSVDRAISLNPVFHSCHGRISVPPKEQSTTSCHSILDGNLAETAIQVSAGSSSSFVYLRGDACMTDKGKRAILSIASVGCKRPQ
jgi:hypothetical protein